jgi:hypothetical protein
LVFSSKYFSIDSRLLASHLIDRFCEAVFATGTINHKTIYISIPIPLAKMSITKNILGIMGSTQK